MSLEARFEAHYRDTYRDNVMMVAQQIRAKFRSAVTEVAAAGEAMNAADLVGSVDAQEDNGIDRRNIENVESNTRRWLVYPNRIRSARYIDTDEKLKRTMDPTSVYVRSHTAAVQREIDRRILGVRKPNGATDLELRDGGILGAAMEGKRPGGTKTALPSENYVDAGGTGLTLAKLKDALEKLRLREFGMDDSEALYCAISPKQVTDLLDIADGDGASLNAFQQLQLQSGMPTTLLGLNWIVTNQLPKDSSGNRLCPIWSRSNIVFGVWTDVSGDMWPDPHADNTPYIRVQARVDCVRVEDGGVEVIRCVES